MNTLYHELTFGLHDPPQIARVVIRLIAAMILGGLVGVQRQRSHKPAGLRTHMLVCLGTAVFITTCGAVGMINSLDPDVYDDGYLRIEHPNYYLTCDGEPVYLLRVEFLLVSRLARSIERVVPAEDLWRAAWGDNKPLNCGSLHVYIHRLRNKLRPHHLQIDVLVNVGYRLMRSKT